MVSGGTQAACLVANDYRFTISDWSKDNIDAIVKDANNILEFLASEGCLTFHEDRKAAASVLYAAKEWCDDNVENALSMKSFANFLSQYAEVYHLIPDIKESGDAIINLREERQSILTEASLKYDLQGRMEDLISFLDEQTGAAEEYSETLREGSSRRSQSTMRRRWSSSSRS